MITSRGKIIWTLGIALKCTNKEFPDGPMVRTPCFHCPAAECPGSIPGQVTKILQAKQSIKKKKKKSPRKKDIKKNKNVKIKECGKTLIIWMMGMLGL